jgi:heat shock protein HslJ
MEQEEAYLQALAMVEIYTIEGHALTLKTEAGATVARFIGVEWP